MAQGKGTGGSPMPMGWYVQEGGECCMCVGMHVHVGVYALV